MMYGHLNLHDGPSGSLTSIAANLETLWGYAIQSILDIPLRDLGVSPKIYCYTSTTHTHKVIQYII